MKGLAELWRRIFHLRRRSEFSQELTEEMHHHLALKTEENISAGMSENEARYAARREFGNVTVLNEDSHGVWGFRWIEELLQDVRYGSRMLRKSPGFTAVAVLTLALGIGANTALFSVVNGVLLNPLPFPHSEQLVTLHESKPNFATGAIPYPNFLDWQKDNTTFAAMAVYRGTSFSLTGLGDAEQIQGRFITSDYFLILGVKPVIGRTFAHDEDERGAPPIVLISAGLWAGKFASSPDALGKTLTLDGRDYAIVGVMPASFGFRNADVYVPFGQWNHPGLARRGAALGIHGVGRLKPGVTIAQARGDMDRVTENLARAYPSDNKGIGAALIPMRQSILGNVQPYLLTLFGAVGFVLLIACINVANLLLARSASQTREFAIRASLGAGQARLLRQLLTESTLLALLGGSLGALLAGWSTRAALGLLPTALPRAEEIHLDARVLLFTLGISVFAGIMFGLAPAWKTTRPDLHDTLKEGGRGSSGARLRVQRIFVVTEMAFALVLLIGAGLMIRTLAHLWNVNPGFNPENVLSFGLSLPPSMHNSSPTATPGADRAAFRDVRTRIAATPGIIGVSLSWGAFPMGTEDDTTFWLQGEAQPKSPSEMKWTLSYVVDPAYLEIMRIPLLRGRFFNSHDDEHAPSVAVIDDVFARQYFGDENPVGKRFFTGDHEGPMEIVGVLTHVKQWGLDTDDTEQLRAQLYRPYMQLDDGAILIGASGTGVVVRSSGADPNLFASLRHALQGSNKEIVLYGAQTMNELISASLAERRFSMSLLSIFAALALVLSSVGIYGVVSYLVGRRTNEIGIRIALGAQRGDVMRLILGDGARMALLGVAIGLAAAFGLTRLLAVYSLLFGVSATDPLTFVAVAGLLTAVALLACYLPARRASRVDPIVALRYE